MAKQHSRSVTAPDIWRTQTRSLPVMHSRTTRRENCAVVTSSFGGKLVPLKMIPLLREDGITNGRLDVRLQMAETAEMLLNPVRVAAAAYFVPKLALERFSDMGAIDRSYNGQQEIDGSVIPWFEELGDEGTREILNTLGIHTVSGWTGNTDYIESYNAVWNHIATNRSPSITLRTRLQSELGPAFWEHTQMRHVVPTFDDALMEGEIPLTVTNSVITTIPGQTYNTSIRTVDGTFTDEAAQISGSAGQHITIARPAGNPGALIVEQGEGPVTVSFDGIMSELAADGVVVSLANIDLARKTAAWARLRNQYQGLSDDYLMDQLLRGIRITDQALKKPMLIDSASTIVGMDQRYATDAANLDKSMTDGQTAVSLNIRVPQTTCGGVVVVVAQALPEQVYERQADRFFHAKTVAGLPDRTRDELDPQPVQLVQNWEVDAAHSDRDGLFGYAPLNHHWLRKAPLVGGKYFQPDPNAPWTEVRNRIWDANVVDPALGPDFYMATSLKHEVFADSLTDPFEWWVSGEVSVTGLTYFGPSLQEGLNDFDAVLSQVPTDRFAGDGTDVGAPGGEG